MKKLLCFFNKHHFLPKKTFTLTIVHHENPNKIVGYEECLRGEQCKNCKERRIKKVSKKYSHKDLTQQAYDWLNEDLKEDSSNPPKKPKSSSGIRLVK